MKHYICTGECNGKAEMPGVCGSSTCSKGNHPLIECKCEDGMHKDVVKKCENCGDEKLCDGNSCDIEPAKPELN